VIRLVEVVTTVANEADAERLARTVIGERLAACASIVPCRSFYPWKGTMCDEPECQIQLKTSEVVAAPLEARLREIHPYEVPAIVRIPLTVADERYARWVAETVEPSGPSS
jgi:periplasmic divalent cation tolerance protein